MGLATVIIGEGKAEKSDLLPVILF